MDVDSKQDFNQLMQDSNLPEDLCTALRNSGYQTIADFAFSVPQQHYLDAWLHAQPKELWEELQVQDIAYSPVVGRLRRFLDRCHTHASGTAPAPARGEPGPSASTRAAPIAENVWAEHAPPRLTPAAVQSMKDTFTANYPGEILDSNAMPSIRLLSIVYQWFRPGNAPQWVPWQLRMSERQEMRRDRSVARKAKVGVS